LYARPKYLDEVNIIKVLGAFIIGKRNVADPQEKSPVTGG
jgi:hypothetical protein